MAAATRSVVWTITGATMFGSKCRHMTFISLAPRAVVASENSNSQELTSDQPCWRCPLNQTDHHHRHDHTGAKHGDNGQNQQERRNTHDHIDHPLILSEMASSIKYKLIYSEQNTPAIAQINLALARSRIKEILDKEGVFAVLEVLPQEGRCSGLSVYL